MGLLRARSLGDDERERTMMGDEDDCDDNDGKLIRLLSPSPVSNGRRRRFFRRVRLHPRAQNFARGVKVMRKAKKRGGLRWRLPAERSNAYVTVVDGVTGAPLGHHHLLFLCSFADLLSRHARQIGRMNKVLNQLTISHVMSWLRR